MADLHAGGFEQPSSFAFDAPSEAEIEMIVARYPAGKQASAVIPLLYIVQHQMKRQTGSAWVPVKGMDAVGQRLGMPPIRVYEVATFYFMFNMNPIGKYHLQLCTTTPCWLRGSDDVVAACRAETGIRGWKETSADGMFTMTEVECVGACVNAPILQVDDDYYEDMDAEKVKQVAREAKERSIPIRIGVNAGSLPPIRALADGEMPPTLPDRMIEAALWEIKVLNEADFDDIKISMKAFDVPTMVEAYRRLATLVPYPLHLGVTEAGTPRAGSVRSAIGIGILLSEGIGDTLRVSLAADPVEEVPICWDILNTLNLRKRGATLVACPTCGRIEIELIPLANKVEEHFTKRGRILTVAVMGCVVNGPGEAKMADLGIAGGKGRGVIFHKGEIVKTVDEPEFMSALIEEGEKIIAEMDAGTYTAVGHADENVIPLMEVPSR